MLLRLLHRKDICDEIPADDFFFCAGFNEQTYGCDSSAGFDSPGLLASGTLSDKRENEF